MNMWGVLAMLIYVGAYTDEVHTNGFHIIELDSTDGALKSICSYPIEQAHFAALDPSGKYVYVNEKDGLGSLAIAADGTLSRRDFVSLGGKAMCHVSWMADGVAWAAYSNGKAGHVKVVDGKFGEGTTADSAGAGPNLPRQSASHPHCAMPCPDGRHYAVCDLGLDSVTIYPGGVTCPTLPKGAGPRHIIYHPNGRLAFIVFELGDMIAAYRCAADGRLLEMLDERHTVGARAGKPVDAAVTVRDIGTAAAIRFSPDGKRVIVSNRFEHSLAVFDFDVETGALKHVATSVLPGSWPRDFIFVGETRALVTMERSGDIHSLAYDPASGRFEVLSSLHGYFRPIALLKR